VERLETLYCGFDGLDVAFEGWLPDAALAMLADRKEAAQLDGKPVPHDLGGVRGFVGATGRPGFAYRFETGDDGEIWWFQRNTSKNTWRIFVSVRSLALAVHGLDRVRDRLYQRLEAFGATVLKESINRADLAIDFRAEGFGPDPAAIIAHSHATKAAECDADVPSVHWTGRRVSSVTVGRMPGRQVILYDKRREAVQTKKFHWFDFWGVPDWRADRRPVWRIEVRAGKQALKKYDATTWAGLAASFADFTADIMGAVRLTVPARDLNHSRWPVHPVWAAALDGLLSYLAGADMTRSGVVPVRKVVGRRAVLRDMYGGLIAGLAASLEAVEDRDGRGGLDIPGAVADLLRRAATEQPAEWAAKVGRARSRLWITEESHSVEREPRGVRGVAPGVGGREHDREGGGGGTVPRVAAQHAAGFQ
jgi:hypothetical protein